MDNKPKPQQIQYKLEHLESYVALHSLLTGKKPEKLQVTEQFFNWYIQEVQGTADALGLNLGFKNDKPTFLNIPIEKKILIETIPTPPIIT